MEFPKKSGIRFPGNNILSLKMMVFTRFYHLLCNATDIHLFLENAYLDQMQICGKVCSYQNIILSPYKRLSTYSENVFWNRFSVELGQYFGSQFNYDGFMIAGQFVTCLLDNRHDYVSIDLHLLHHNSSEFLLNEMKYVYRTLIKKHTPPPRKIPSFGHGIAEPTIYVYTRGMYQNTCFMLVLIPGKCPIQIYGHVGYHVVTKYGQPEASEESVINSYPLSYCQIGYYRDRDGNNRLIYTDAFAQSLRTGLVSVDDSLDMNDVLECYRYGYHLQCQTTSSKNLANSLDEMLKTPRPNSVFSGNAKEFIKKYYPGDHLVPVREDRDIQNLISPSSAYDPCPFSPYSGDDEMTYSPYNLFNLGNQGEGVVPYNYYDSI